MSIYHKHKCGVLIPLFLLILVDILAFLLVTDDISVLVANIRTELLIFTFTLTLTYYYLFKNANNIRQYFNWFKRKKDEFK